MDTRAGKPASPNDLIDVDRVIDAYYDLTPNLDNPAQRVAFGTSGHRGSSLDAAFNEAHIIATTQAIIEFRRDAGITGPLFIGRDTHALSAPAWETAIEVLAAAEVQVRIDSRNSWTPTPAISHAILAANAEHRAGQPQPLADGIVVTPSHNPPRDGGFKYNGPDGGPADSDVTNAIARRANELLSTGVKSIPRIPLNRALGQDCVRQYDFMEHYIDDLPSVIDIPAIRRAGVNIGVDPLGGAAVEYWGRIAEDHQLNLTVVNQVVDPRWGFMTLDWDGKIRMDCSSPYAMASLLGVMANSNAYDVAIGNDADADRHGIVTVDGGLMNPNHFLAVSIAHLFGGGRPQWPTSSGIGKTLVSSSLIDRVARDLNREVVEVPVGFKWFVPGLLDGSLGFGGEESAGASLLRHDGTVWTTDKDGIVLGLLAAEICAQGASPSEVHHSLVNRYGESWYTRIDAAASPAQKSALGKLNADQVSSTDLAGDSITAVLTHAPGNGAGIGGLKVVTDNSWFAARPSGTEDVYKIYAESFVSADHLTQVQAEARSLVDGVLGDLEG